MFSPFKVLKTYVRVRPHWEDICNCCGLCCYERDLTEDGAVSVCFTKPCEFLDEETHRCSVYPQRFSCQPRCGKMTLRIALFDPYLPPSCAYVQLFRTESRL